MGAWGYGPYDNDPARTWLDEVMDPVKDRITKGIEEKDYDVQRASIHLLRTTITLLDIDDAFSLAERAVDKTKWMLSDIDWLDSWRDDRDLRKSLRSDMNFFKKWIRDTAP